METIEARRLTIYLGDEERYRGKPLYRCLLNLLLEEGIAGATVLRAIEGYGSEKKIRTARILDLSVNMPMMIVAVDLEEKIDAVLPKVDEMVNKGLITVEKVEIVSRAPSFA